MNKDRKIVIVTGGAGYIGSHTAVELYAAGYLPVIVDNYSNSNRFVPLRVSELCGHDIQVFEADCRDREQMDQVFEACGNVFAVIHFAAFKAVGESVAMPAKYYENNIGSLANLLQTMENHGMPALVFSSSCTVYGEPDQLPVTESAPEKPASSPYGYTKQVCEQLIRDGITAEIGLNAVTLRYFNPIGAHPTGRIGELPLGTPNNLVPFIAQTAAGIRKELTVFGDDYNTIDGTCVRDYIHVVDLARAHVSALRYLEDLQEESSNTVVNIGTGTGASVLEVVKTFEEVTGQPLNYKIGPRRPGDVEAVWAASESNVLGWEAGFSLKESLRDAWNWQMELRNEGLGTRDE